jgi:hypothetical protein
MGTVLLSRSENFKICVDDPPKLTHFVCRAHALAQCHETPSKHLNSLYFAAESENVSPAQKISLASSPGN